MNKKISRNDPCPCGSGEKYKKCCAKKELEHKQKKFLSLKGRAAPAVSGSMRGIANRVLQVLTKTTPSADSKQEAVIEAETAALAEKRGYRTLEELIGVETKSCSSHECCCCHEENVEKRDSSLASNAGTPIV